MTQVDLETLVHGGVSSQDNLDFPPDSFCVSKDQEQDWLDNNAFIERKNSGKNSCAHQPQPTGPQRFTHTLFKSKASIICLPKPHSNASFVKKCKPAETRLFPKRTSLMLEPGSPKVSCMGRVRSKRRSRNSRGDGKLKSGFLASFRAFFRPCSKRNPAGKLKECDDEHDMYPNPSGVIEPRFSAAESEPAGLGGMKPFASGRKSDSWVDDDIARY